MRDGEPLFSKFSLWDALETQKGKVGKAVESLPEGAVMDASGETAARLLRELSIAVLELHVDRTNVASEETRIDVSWDQRRLIRDRSRPCYVPGTAVRYYVPFSGDKQLFRAQPNQFDWNRPSGRVEGSELVLTYEVEGPTVAQTKASYEQELGRIRNYISRVNAMVEEFNAALPGLIQQHLTARQQRLRDAQKGLEELGLPVRGR